MRLNFAFTWVKSLLICLIKEAYRNDDLSKDQVLWWRNELEWTWDCWRRWAIWTPFDKRWVAHKEFLPLGQTASTVFYKDVLAHLYRAIKWKWPEIAYHRKLHHDNAPTHTASLARIGVATLPQMPYSPYLSPSNFSCCQSSREVWKVPVSKMFPQSSWLPGSIWSLAIVLAEVEAILKNFNNIYQSDQIFLRDPVSLLYGQTL